MPGESSAEQGPTERQPGDRASGLGIVGMTLAAAELTQEVVVVVGAQRTRGCLVAVDGSAALDDPHGEIDRDREEDHDEQELQHPSNVGRQWWRPTLRV